MASTSLDSFSHESRIFGVPLAPFPPGGKWTSTLEMIQEVFSDLRYPWVRQYLLRPSNVEDIHGLTSAANYSKAFSLNFRAKTIESLSQGFKSAMLYVRLNIPVHSRGDIGAGIGVESSNVQDSGDVFYTKSDLFFRYVSNNARNSHLNIRLFKDRSTIEATYMVYMGTLWQYAILVFDHDAFLAAFNDNTEFFDAYKVNQALIQSMVGGLHHDRYPKSSKNEYPYAIADNVGEHFFKNVLCSYAGGLPMMTVPIVAHGNWSYNYDAAALRKMQTWGIIDRLQGLTVSPVKQARIRPAQNLKRNYNTSPRSKRAGMDNDVIDCTASPSSSHVPPVGPSVNSSSHCDTGFARIAPLPLPATGTSGNIMRLRTMEETEEETRKKKSQERIIKRREAAARSNAKRAERRKKLLMQNTGIIDTYLRGVRLRE